MVHLTRCPRICLLIPIGEKSVKEEQAVDNYPWVLTTCPDDYDKAFVCGLDVEQAVSNIPVEPKEILNLPPGPDRDKWIAACKKEVNSLKETRTKSDITLQQAENLRKERRQKGVAFVQLPMMARFTIKPGEIFKCRLCSCGNKTDETYGDTSTNELDVALFRYMISQPFSTLGIIKCILQIYPPTLPKHCSSKSVDGCQGERAVQAEEGKDADPSRPR